MKKTGKIWIVIVIVMLVLIIALGSGAFFIYSAATDLTDADKINTEKSYAILEPLLKSVVLGEEQAISNDEINGVLAAVMNTYTESLEKSDTKDTLVAKGASVYLSDNESAKIYADLYYNDIRFIFTAEAFIKLDAESQTIIFNIKNTKIGSLPIPTTFIMSKLDESLRNISDQLDVDGDNIIIPSEYTINILEKDITLKINQLEISNNSAKVQTTSAMEAIEGVFDDFLKGIIG